MVRPQFDVTRAILKQVYRRWYENVEKPPLAEAQSALGKQKIRSVERWYLSFSKILRKTASPRKILLKSDNRLLSYAQKTISSVAAVRRLEFKTRTNQ